MKRFFLYLSLAIYTSCNSPHSKILKEYPSNVRLTWDVFRKSERIIIDNNYYILQINALYKSEYYEPYLLFYNRKKKLDFSTYNPGTVINIRDSIVKGYYSEFRSKKTETSLPNSYKMSFLKKVPTNSNNIDGKELFLIKVYNDTIFFKSKEQNPNSNDVVKFHMNDLIFSPHLKNTLEIIEISDTVVNFFHYKTDESALKQSLWEYINKN
jgi:hypothetical protein